MDTILFVMLVIYTSFCVALGSIFAPVPWQYHLPKSQWECTARDVRPKHGKCVEYHVKEKE